MDRGLNYFGEGGGGFVFLCYYYYYYFMDDFVSGIVGRGMLILVEEKRVLFVGIFVLF